MEKKICSKCRINQDVSNFYVDKTKVDGFYSCCKTCKKNYFNTRTDEMKLYLKKWRSNNPDYIKNKDVMLSRVKKHYHDNKEKIRKNLNYEVMNTMKKIKRIDWSIVKII
jgi:hypothetical protein